MAAEETKRVAGGAQARDPLAAFKGGRGEPEEEIVPTRASAEAARAARASGAAAEGTVANVSRPERAAEAGAESGVAPGARAGGAPAAPVRGAGEDAGKVRDSFQLPGELLEKVKDAVYWTQWETKNSLIERALRSEIARMEEARGGPFPKREKELGKGRRVGA